MNSEEDAGALHYLISRHGHEIATSRLEHNTMSTYRINGYELPELFEADADHRVKAILALTLRMAEYAVMLDTIDPQVFADLWFEYDRAYMKLWTRREKLLDG